jgi:cysteine desulfurase
MRSGTENVASIVGFGKACELAKENMQKNISHMQNLQRNLITKVMKEIPQVTFNGHKEQRIPNNAHFTFLGVNGEDLIIKLDENGIAASTGSACSVHVQKESHVLKAMGFSHDQITGSLRLTVGILNTNLEIEKTVEILKIVVKELRAFSPLKEKYGF